MIENGKINPSEKEVEKYKPYGLKQREDGTWVVPPKVWEDVKKRYGL
jgi:hypothetical protein